MERSRTITRWVVAIAGLVGVLAVAGFAWVWFAPCWLGGCAPVADLAEYQAEGSELLDIHGEPYGTLASVNRRIVSLDSLPPYLPQAFLAVEDRRFYDHGGIDFQRLVGALLSNIRAGQVTEGGSTITQQLARNLFPEWLPYRERSLRRKILEARVARQIERAFAKDKILELYLNHIYLGEGAYGVEAAARTYFGKSAAELTLPEAALLGGLPKAPSQINPVANRKAAQARRDLVLSQMAEAGYITLMQASLAKDEPVRLADAGDEADGLRGSYFIERVRQELEQVVGSRFYTAGLRIHTTLDPRAQRAAEEELARQLDAVEAGEFGAYRYRTYPEAKGVASETGRTPYVQGAVVLMDARTGEVRALVGGRDFEDSKFDRAVQAARQPGSAFKPFVYLAALERFGSPTHVVEDAPIRMVMDNGEVWEPRNYTGRYDGPMTLREALTRSKNLVTVRLSQEVGLDPIIRTARRLGISGRIPATPAVVLGTASVRPIEMVRAYAAFANDGRLVEPHFIRRVVDRHGRVVWEAETQTEEVLEPEEAFVMTSMLEDVVNRGTGTAARAAGYTGPAAGKTGTTNDAADVWFIGYTPELVGGVWMGMDEPRTIVRGASGGTLAAPVWGRIVARYYQGKRVPAPWSPPPSLITAEVERATGMVVGEGCPARGPTYTEYFLYGAPPAATCRSTMYPQIAYDTMWMDEEWGAGTLELDTAYLDLEDSGIDWPQLEEMRRRIRLEAQGSPPASEESPPMLGQPAPSRPAPDGPAPRPARPEDPPPATDGDRPSTPRILGVPVRRDSTGSPTPTDTTRAGGAAAGERIPR